MPQFDQATFLSQIFWTFLFFIVLYLFLLRGVLPAISTVLKLRNKWFNTFSDVSLQDNKSFDTSYCFNITVDFLSKALISSSNKVESVILLHFNNFESSTKILGSIEENKNLMVREISSRQDFRKKSILLAGMKNYHFV